MSRAIFRAVPVIGCAALASLFAGACGGDAIVDLTIGLDPAVTDPIIARIQGLAIDVTGAETAMVSDALEQPFAVNRQERMVVRAPAGGAVTIAITARDADGNALLFGQATLTIETGSERAQLVVLAPIPSGVDGGMDLAPIDLAGTDAPPPDLARGDLAQVVCPGTVLLCDGFESGTIDALVWDQSTTTTLGTVTPDQSRAHRGQWSLHLHLATVGAGATAVATVGEIHTFTPPGATFFVRAYYYFPSSASTAVATLLDTSQASGAGQGVSLAIDHDALSIYDGFAAGNYTASTTPKLPLDAWTCVEWQVYTGTPNAMHAWVNGAPVATLDLQEATTGTPQIGQADIGLAIYPPNTSASALDVWLDDVIIDSAPIGCAK